MLPALENDSPTAVIEGRDERGHVASISHVMKDGSILCIGSRDNQLETLNSLGIQYQSVKSHPRNAGLILKPLN